MKQFPCETVSVADPSIEPTEDPSEDLDRLFRSALRLTWSWMSPQVLRSYVERAGAGIEPGQYQTLVFIGGAGPVRLRDLAAGTAMTASNASKIVAELVDAGLVTRTVPRTDRRVTLLEVTPAGRRAVDRLEAVGRQMLAERLEGFSEAEVAVLGSLLGRLADATAGWSSTLPAGDTGTGVKEEGAA